MSKIGIQTHGVNHSIMRKGLRGGGIAKRGTGVALKGGGRAAKFGGGRTNLLEELGRVEGEHSNRNRRDEIARVHSELNRGYAKGGRAAFDTGKKVDKKKSDDKWTGKKYGMGYYIPGLDEELRKGKPHSTPEGRDVEVRRKLKALRGYGKAYMKGGRAK